MKKRLLIATLLVSTMCLSLTGCGFSIGSEKHIGSVSFGGSKDSEDTMQKKLAKETCLDEDQAEDLAEILEDELDFGKIEEIKDRVEDGEGKIKLNNGKTKLVVYVEDDELVKIENDDDEVVYSFKKSSSKKDKEDKLNTVEVDEKTEDEIMGIIDDLPTDVIEDGNTGGSISHKSGNSYLSDEAHEIIDSLDTDFNKVNWGVIYSPEGMDGIVISVASMKENKNDNYLIVGLTNLYGYDVNISGKAKAKDGFGGIAGEATMFAEAVGSGNTYLYKIWCADVTPNGEIRWEDFEVKESSKSYVPWEGDYKLKNDEDGYVIVDYDVYAANGSSKLTLGDVNILGLDSKGNIIGFYHDYNYETTNNKFETYQKNPGIKDVAMFCNPIK